MKKPLKIIGFIILAVFVIGVLINAPKKEAEPSTTETVTAGPPTPEKPEVEILSMDESLEEVTNSRTVHVRVKNNSDKLITYLDLKSVYTSKSGNIVGTGIGNSTNIAPGATKVVDVLAMGIENANTYDVEVNNVLFK